MITTVEADRRRPLLLLIGDDPNQLAVLAGVLEPHYPVQLVHDGELALRAATASERPDLILLDLLMPDVDGAPLLDRLKSDARSRDIPVISVTPSDGDGVEHRGLVQGAIDFITRPIRTAVVLARVRTHLAYHEARTRLLTHNVWLEGEIERRTRDNALMQDVSLSILAGLVETRDTDTGNHTMRTQAYVEVIGRRLQRAPRFVEALSPAALGLMVKAAPLHDIGKIGISDAILLKRGPLTTAEFEVMKTHARKGGDAIAHALARVEATVARAADGHTPEPLLFLETARQMALWHHEKWDGRGYPDRLVREDIPLCARLMGVADVFDALTTRRVYKPSMTPAEAFQLITDGSGTEFDPEVVAAFQAVKSEIADIAQRYADVTA